MEAWVRQGTDLRGLLRTLPTVLPPCCSHGAGDAASAPLLATEADLKRAYRKALLAVHPDKLSRSGISLTERAHAMDVFAVLSEAAQR